MIWYLRFKLSYRDLGEMARQFGVLVAPSTILRWVVRYASEFQRCWQPFEQPVNGSWRADETYIRVRGRWVSCYRAVDSRGKTVESYLSYTRDITAAKAFFRKALRHHGQPRTITLDGFCCIEEKLLISKHLHPSIDSVPTALWRHPVLPFQQSVYQFDADQYATGIEEVLKPEHGSDSSFRVLSVRVRDAGLAALLG